MREVMEEKVFLRKHYDGSKDFVIPQGFTEIWCCALEKMDTLETLEIPGSVKKIGGGAFSGCRNLRRVILHEGLETVEENVFTGCSSLSSLTIPDSVRSLRGWAFYECTGLKGAVYNTSGTILYYYPKESLDRRIVIPDGVKKIGAQAFLDAEKLQEVVLPEGLEEIGWMAFDHASLTELVLPSSLKRVERDAFYECRKLDTVHIRCGCSAIKGGAFGASVPSFLAEDRTVYEGMRRLKLLGECLVKKRRTEIPQDAHEEDPVFLQLAKRCGERDTKAMWEMADYFYELGRVRPEPFYEWTGNFWRYFASMHGDKTAEAWAENWVREHPGACLPAVLEIPFGEIEGETLYAAGFLFFHKNRRYHLIGPDENGVVEASSYRGADGPDEDGFGMENAYDWWYLTDCLTQAPGAEPLADYSELDKKNAGERFRREYEKAAAAVRNSKKQEK